MTEEVKTEEVQVEPTDASITEDDLFSLSPDEVVEADETVEAEAPADEEAAPKTPEPEEESAAPEMSLQEQLDKVNERLKTTRDYATQNNQKLQTLISRVENGETLSAEEIAEIKAGNAQLSDNPMQTIVDQVTKEFPILAPVYKRNGEDPDLYVEAFGNMAQHDQALQQELLQMEPTERTAFVLSKGKELSETYSGIKEHGSILGAYQALKSDNADALEAARKEGIKQGRKEVEDKYKDVVSPSKPRLSGKGSLAEGSEHETGEITENDLFG